MNKLAAFFGIALSTTIACGDVGTNDPAGPDAGADIEQPDGGDNTADNTAPTVLSVTPADAANGIRANARVVFEFSEPMDQLSVQNSIDTSDLGGVTFAWSDNSTVLTITPDSPLQYAEGKGVNPGDTVAKKYTVVIGTGATDEAGNNLESGAQTTFSTLKAIETTFGRDNALTGAGNHVEVVTDADDFIYVGDDALEGLASAYRGYITMDMSLLPTTAVDIVAAKLESKQLAELGTPYAVLGSGTGVIMEHGTFMLGDSNSDNAAFNMTPLSEVGVFANKGDTDLAINVTTEVKDDLANRAARNSRSQYRLRFSTFTNLDAVANYVLIDRDSLALTVIYLAP
jgi:hypothetical protein